MSFNDDDRAQGQVWRQAHAGYISLGQLKVMSAIEACRSAALGGHVLRYSSCEHQQNIYNSCRNRHRPKCQGSAAHRWLEARQVDLLPVEYLPSGLYLASAYFGEIRPSVGKRWISEVNP